MKTCIKKGVCLLTAVLFCCLSAACQPTMNEPAITTTTTIANNDTVTTTTAQSSESTTVGDKMTTTSPSTTTTMTGSVPLSTTSTSTTKATTTTTTPVVQNVKVYINDVLFSDFDPSVTQYTYPLHPTVTVAPTVKLQNGGAVTQATSANGMVSFALGGKTYRIQFEKKAQSSFLDNTYYKLKVEKKLNIGYIGGSVTQGVGGSSHSKRWANLTTEWFKKQFPDAAITENNVAIGGTNSELGCYRIYHDLQLADQEKRPDLIFVEFSINDHYDSTDSAMYMEGLIRSIYQHAPETDIYLVLVTDWGVQNTDSKAIKAHKSLARTYLLPYSQVGAKLWDTIVFENGGNKPETSNAVWQKYFTDIVHPTDAGYALMCQYLTDDLDAIFKAKTAVASKPKSAYSPMKSVCERPVPYFPHAETFKGTFSTAKGVTIAKDGALSAIKPSSYFSFEFTGTELKFWVISDSESADLEIVIDGSITKTISLYAKTEGHRVVKIANGLDNKKHHATVTIKKGKQAARVHLKAVLTSGASLEPLTLL